MPVKRPNRGELARIAEALRLPLDEAELSSYATLADTTLERFSRLDALPDTVLEPRYPHRDSGRPPDPENNPHHGWAWCCSITEAEQGPLAGVRVAVKDTVEVAGVPMRIGTPIMDGFVPREDATVVARVLDAGGEIVGKTSVPGSSWDGAALTGHPEPQPSNPYDAARLPGGSSAGNGVVLVTEQADVAIGGDQGGSVRLPASWSGCCGLKPTHGLVPYTGAFSVEATVDHLGPMAPTVANCAELLEVVAGEDGLDPRQYHPRTERYTEALDEGINGLRIGVLREGFGIPDVSEPDVDSAVCSAAEALAEAGADVREVSVPMHLDGLPIWTAIALEGAAELMIRGDALGTNRRGHYPTHLGDFYGRARRARGHDLSPTVALTGLLGTYLSERYNHHYYAKAQNLALRLREDYDTAFEQVDLLLLPTAAMKAPLRPANPSIEETVGTALGNLHNTTPTNVTGHPALSVPCGLSGGLPVGAMLVGRYLDEATLIRAGHAYEQRRAPLPPPKAQG